MKILSKSQINLFLLVFFSILLGFVSCKKSDDPASVDYTDQLQTMIDSKWDAYWVGKHEPIGGVMFKISSPQGDFFVSANHNNLVNETVHFRGGSTTKMFTAASIMLLKQQGKLNIEDFLTDTIPGTSEPYIPDLPEYDIPYKNEISIKQMLQHRSGIYDITNDPAPTDIPEPYAGMTFNSYVMFVLQDSAYNYTTPEFTEILAKYKLSYFKPDSAFHYSNVGYKLLGLIIERISGMSCEDFFTVNFSNPLGLTKSSFSSDPTIHGLPEPFVHGYYVSAEYIGDVTRVLNLSSGVGDGNIITTCYDLNKWNKKLLQGEAGLSMSTVAEMMECKETFDGHKYYGLGINYTPGLGYGHNGGVLGYMTITRYNPDNQVTVTINASFLEADDMYKEGDFLYDIAHGAYKIMGYE